MGTPLRDKDPDSYRLITIRTEGACLFMRPSKDVNKIIGGILARYSELLGIHIYAYIFLSNHFHLVIRAPNQNTDELLENVDREIARRINWKIRRSGTFWARRYDDLKILSEDDLVEAFLYVTTNAVRHGLVSDAGTWPGLCSYVQSLSEKTQSYSFHHYSAKNEEERVTHHKLKIRPLPQFAAMSKKERAVKLKALIDERVVRIKEERKAAGLGFLGAEFILSQDPFSTSINVSRTKRPCGYSKDYLLKKAYRKSRSYLRELYTEASMRYRFGLDDYAFPAFTFLPPLHRKPRLSPFCEVSEDYFRRGF